jgi:hypothetical protein
MVVYGRQRNCRQQVFLGRPNEGHLMSSFESASMFLMVISAGGTMF